LYLSGPMLQERWRTHPMLWRPNSTHYREEELKSNWIFSQQLRWMRSVK
jgi:hypothetical protein